MAIKIYNENRLTRQPFFRNLLDFVSTHEATRSVTLRDIHRQFATAEMSDRLIDRQLEKILAAGLIKRSDKHYFVGLPVYDDENFPSALTENSVTSHRNLIYEKPFFVSTDSHLATLLDASIMPQTLQNQTNSVIFHEFSSYDHKSSTLSNYFFKVRQNLPLSPLEQELYDLMGDVDPEYALKYMTTFLLKFADKESDAVARSRADIFVTALVKLGYAQQIDATHYRCLLPIQPATKLIETVKLDDAAAFIQAQIAQTQPGQAFISLGE